MQHEKIIKREDGSAVQITVYLGVGSYEDSVYWSIDVNVRAPKKKKFLSLYSGDEYEFRKLSLYGRKAYVFAKQLEVATPAEILSAKLELWQKLKPTI